MVRAEQTTENKADQNSEVTIKLKYVTVCIENYSYS